LNTNTEAHMDTNTSLTAWRDGFLAACGQTYPGRTIVLGGGMDKPCLVLVGEAPGGQEEKQGLPFVGAAGKNLSEFLDVLGLSRAELYITNVVKLRPHKPSPRTGKPINRPPDAAELAFFTPFLLAELQCLKPALVVSLGNVPLRALTRAGLSIGQVHGQEITTDKSFSIFPLYHPASIIYNQQLKQVYQKDLLALRDLMALRDFPRSNDAYH